MTDWEENYGTVHGREDLRLTEEPAEIDEGVYLAEAVDASGRRYEVELEGWGDGDYDCDSPLDIREL